MEKHKKTADKLARGGKPAEDIAEDCPPTEAGPMEGREGQLNSEQQAVIGRHLQALYDEIVKQELPQKLKDLLANLDKVPDKER